MGGAARARWGLRWGARRARLDDLAMVAVAAAASAIDVVDAANNERLGAEAWLGAALTAALAPALWWRRRAPVLLTGGVCAAVALGASQVLLSLTLLTLAIRRRDRVLPAAMVGAVAARLVASWRFDPTLAVAERVTGQAFLVAVVIALPVACGAFLGARRDLLASLRERVGRAEAEQRLLAERARAAERTRIAREMHDVLGHRISLVALHAGGLEVSAVSDEAARSAALVRTTAREALEDLREILGVLRADPADAAPAGEVGGAGGQERWTGESEQQQVLAPQPRLGDVGDLVRASGAAGVRVRLEDAVAPGAAVPPLVGRTAYRVVQEALTNVHKHAPGAAATVRLSGGCGDGLLVEVLSAPPVTGTGAPAAPSSGFGLVGLRERVDLVGGRLEAGVRGDGGFALRATLPWPAPGDSRG